MWLCIWQFSNCGPVVSIMQTRKCFLKEEIIAQLSILGLSAYCIHSKCIQWLTLKGNSISIATPALPVDVSFCHTLGRCTQKHSLWAI